DVYSQHLLEAGPAPAFCCCGWLPGARSSVTRSPCCELTRRPDRFFQMCLRFLPEYFSSWAYGRLLRDRCTPFLPFGAPLHNPETGRPTSYRRTSAPLWRCSDPAPGPLTPDSLGGSESMCEIENVSFRPRRGPFLTRKGPLAAANEPQRDSVRG